MTERTARDHESAVAGGVRARALLIGILGVIPLTLFVQWSDVLIGGTAVAGPFPPVGASLFWVLLLCANALIARRLGEPPLRRSELLLILAVWLAANMVAGRGLVHPLLGALAGPAYFARGGSVAAGIARYMPAGIIIKDRMAAQSFYEGGTTGPPWRAWLPVLGTWSLFFGPFLLANACLAGLFEHAWVRQERLAYPLAALPIEVLGGAGGPHAGRPPLHRRTLFWVGVSFPLLLHGFGVANAYVPAIPALPFYNEFSTFLTAPPWSAARPIFLNLYPSLIGLAFLAPADVTCGVWFFLLMTKIELVASSAYGWVDAAPAAGVPQPPYLEDQSAGAYIALAAMMAWRARRHLSSAARAMFGDRSHPDSSGYCWLGWGFVAGCAGSLAWLAWSGIPIWFAALYFGFTLIVALVLGRLMSEGGITWTLAPAMPDSLLLSIVGSAALSRASIVRLMPHAMHLRDTRQMPGPALFQAGKLRDEAKAPLASAYGLLIAAMALAIAFGVCAALPIFHRFGALNLQSQNDGVLMSTRMVPMTAVEQASARLTNPTPSSAAPAIAIAAGAAITLLLALVRSRLAWWPLHPLGYALTGTLQVGYANKMLLSIFLAWLFKTLSMRLGGSSGFRRMRDVALGLIVGDLLIGAVTKLLDLLLGPNGYAIF
jgi:hypothetical protein